MGFVKSNFVPLLVGVAVGYFLVPRALTFVKNR